MFEEKDGAFDVAVFWLAVYMSTLAAVTENEEHPLSRHYEDMLDRFSNMPPPYGAEFLRDAGAVLASGFSEGELDAFVSESGASESGTAARLIFEGVALELEKRKEERHGNAC